MLWVSGGASQCQKADRSKHSISSFLFRFLGPALAWLRQTHRPDGVQNALLAVSTETEQGGQCPPCSSAPSTVSLWQPLTWGCWWDLVLVLTPTLSHAPLILQGLEVCKLHSPDPLLVRLSMRDEATAGMQMALMAGVAGWAPGAPLQVARLQRQQQQRLWSPGSPSQWCARTQVSRWLRAAGCLQWRWPPMTHFPASPAGAAGFLQLLLSGGPQFPLLIV